MPKRALNHSVKRRLSNKRLRQKKTFVLIILGLMLASVLGAVAGPWRNSLGARKLGTLISPPVAPPPTTDPTKPSKEYIYAGGKLIATEEPSANSSPTIQITAPSNNSVFAPGSNVQLTATATDADGSISQVQFFQNGTLLGQATPAGGVYNFTWNGVTTGTYSLTAKATDNLGAIGTSATVSITVNSNSVPTVNITYPANGAEFPAPAGLTVMANASDAEGSVTKVDFYQNGNLIGTDTTSPFSVLWNGIGAGTYTLTAIATDNLGATGTSDPISITVKLNAAPTVSITSPANGAVFTAPANITIVANATDPDGSVTRVDFYQGSSVIGTDTAAPFTVPLNNLGVGTYSLQAIAMDNLGAVAASSTVSITVNPNSVPTVSISSPANGAVFTAPANITIAANASDADGSISKVDFYQGSSLIGTDTAAPFTVPFNSVGVGTYSLTAKATDNLGTIGTSSPVSITVNPNSVPTVNITSPANGAVFIAPANITIAANASDADGSVTKVDFFQGTTFIGTDTAAPFTVPFNSVGVGTYSLTAKATDNLGAVGTSSPVSITVNPNSVPAVSITNPVNGAVFTAPANITIAANANDADGSVTKVDFFQGTTLIGTDTTSPYTVPWNSVAAGTYSLTAKATDNLGADSTSAPITVVSNAPPTVSISSPASNAMFAAPANITITANASDADGTVTKVDFYQGSGLIGTDTTSPYSVPWNNVASGSYILTAQATDNRGVITVSAPVAVTTPTFFDDFNDNSLDSTKWSLYIPSSPAVVSEQGQQLRITIPASTATYNGVVSNTSYDMRGGAAQVELVQAASQAGWVDNSMLVQRDDQNFYQIGVGAGSIVFRSRIGGIESASNIPFDPVGHRYWRISHNQISDLVSLETSADGLTWTTRKTVTGGFSLVGVKFVLNAGAWGPNNASPGAAVYNDFQAIATPALQTATPAIFSDDFNDNSINTTKWDADNLFSGFTSFSVPIAETLQRLEIGPLLQGAGGSNYRGVRTVNTYNLTGAYAYVELVQAPVSTTSADAMFTIGTDVDNYYRIGVTAGNLVGTRKVGGTKSTLFTIPYDLNNHRFLRIRHDAGSVRLETAPGTGGIPGTWTQHYSEIWSSAIPPTALIFEIKAGTSQETSAPGKVIFDNFVASASSGAPPSNTPPSVSITNPANGAVFTAPANIPMTASASDSDGSVTQVEFYAGSTLIGTDTSAPYSVTWNNVVAGTYSLTAKATDNSGMVTTSAAVSINVNPACTPATTIIISEFRLRGPNGSSDEYIELYNNSDQSVGVCTADSSSGWSLVSSDGMTRFVVPVGTIIPARAHYLATAAGYSLGAYGGSTNGNISISVDVPDNTGLALFNSANPANFTLVNRLDAVGFTTSGTLYREGAGLAALGANAGEYSFLRKLNSEVPQDTSDNVADFTFVATNAGLYGGTLAILGAPGPENLFSPLLKAVSLPVTMLDPAVGASVAPNRVRDTAAVGPNAAAGTMSLRRTVTNNTGVSVTRLRFRVIDITTLNTSGYTPGGTQSDMRVLNSSDFTATLTSGQQVLVRGTTVESPPLQSMGGGLNSTLTLSLSQPLAPGQTMSFQWLLGVQQSGSFRFFVSVEALVQ